MPDQGIEERVEQQARSCARRARGRAVALSAGGVLRSAGALALQASGALANGLTAAATDHTPLARHAGQRGHGDSGAAASLRRGNARPPAPRHRSCHGVTRRRFVRSGTAPDRAVTPPPQTPSPTQPGPAAVPSPRGARSPGAHRPREATPRPPRTRSAAGRPRRVDGGVCGWSGRSRRRAVRDDASGGGAQAPGWPGAPSASAGPSWRAWELPSRHRHPRQSRADAAQGRQGRSYSGALHLDAPEPRPLHGVWDDGDGMGAGEGGGSRKWGRPGPSRGRERVLNDDQR